ncbi:MAG: glutathione S-transferase family protein [Hyphomicrobiaceae bacterium]|nr:MAG: glutathione S-transferase family protein [Hyphomicrobiaceae bacterium]
MILVGHYDSPFVRRVGIALNLFALPFERNLMSVFADAEAMRAINPTGRIPSLQLDDGEIIIDSAAILDHLDEVVGPRSALLPSHGRERRRAMYLTQLACGAIDKTGAVAYERMLRPAERQYGEWIDRCRTQASSALRALEEAAPAEGWLMGDRLMLPDITTACALAYIRYRSPQVGDLGSFARLQKLSRAAEKLSAFQACLPSLKEIGGEEAEARAALARLALTG